MAGPFEVEDAEMDDGSRFPDNTKRGATLGDGRKVERSLDSSSRG